tara:strand:- start:925 stop:2331 length:1407 start_codon:yes stop_codon:yes gene_type:complete
MLPTTALSKYVAVDPTFIYEAVDPDTNVPFYVGRTVNLKRRTNEHQKRCTKKVREIMRLKNFRLAEVTRRVPELPNGCAPADAQEMEAFFIVQRKVVYDPDTSPNGCNSRIGDFGIELTPARMAELRRMFAGEGYQFPLVEEPKDLRDARADYEIAGEFVVMAEDVGDDKSVKVFNECRVLAKRVLLNAERTHLGLRAFVELVLSDYEDKYIDAVNQPTLQTALNLIKEKMGEDEAFADLQRIVSSISLVCKEKEGVDVSSEAAAYFLKGVLAMIGSREEATLAWTHKTVEVNIKSMRAWTKSHGMQKPLRTSIDKEEKSLGDFLDHWKVDSDHYGGKCTHLSNCRIVMRGIPWFEDYLGSSDKNANDWTALNTQLRNGFAWFAEPDFEGKKAISGAKDNVTIYDKLNSLVKGRGKPSDVATVLKGLPTNRAAYYQGRYDANRSTHLQRSKEAKKKRKHESACTAEEE